MSQISRPPDDYSGSSETCSHKSNKIARKHSCTIVLDRNCSSTNCCCPYHNWHDFTDIPKSPLVIFGKKHHNILYIPAVAKHLIHYRESAYSSKTKPQVSIRLSFLTSTSLVIFSNITSVWFEHKSGHTIYLHEHKYQIYPISP